MTPDTDLRARVLASVDAGALDVVAALVWADQLEERGDPRSEFWRLVGKRRLWPLSSTHICWGWWCNPKAVVALCPVWYLPANVFARLGRPTRKYAQINGHSEMVKLYGSLRRALVCAEAAWIGEG